MMERIYHVIMFYIRSVKLIKNKNAGA